jgi:Mg2+ and Co2+ transporter CorA
MQSAFFHLTTLATLAVLAVLIAGLWTMMRGDSPNLSQKLMRWRVGLQFLALVIIMVFVFLTRGI